MSTKREKYSTAIIIFKWGFLFLLILAVSLQSINIYNANKKLSDDEIIALGFRLLTVFLKPENMYYSTDDGNSLYPNIYNLYTSDLITDEFISNKYWIDIGGYYGAPGSLSPDMSPVQWIIILPSQNNGFIYVITNRFVHPLDPKFELRRYPYTQLNKIYSGLTRFSDMDEIPVTVIATYTYENAGTITSVNTL